MEYYSIRRLDYSSRNVRMVLSDSALVRSSHKPMNYEHWIKKLEELEDDLTSRFDVLGELAVDNWHDVQDEYELVEAALEETNALRSALETLAKKTA